MKCLTPSLWVAQSRLYFSNSGVFLSEGRACLVDPGVFPEEIEALARFLEERGAPPEVIVLTHSHWDHLLGPERFPGVKIIAQANYLAAISGRAADEIPWQIEEWAAEHGIDRPQPFSLPEPDETFGEMLELAVGELALRLVHAPGHAVDQAVVYEPESATLWAADMLSDLEIPFVSHSLSAYEETLAMLSAWEVRVLIPGHGQPTASKREIRSRLEEDRAYLAELRARVLQAVREGLTVGEAVRLCADMPYRHPQENIGPHRLNVESAYLELGGEADATKVGWNRL
ncbi:MAG: MBL fold metallo-hydrolase [Candidatus Acetothermia bacterium]|nr:MBL fold metallo-hydrolase [Candidatus Acetothermia bacterium]MDH7504674.1 MBL fold metallo-hydrolase [Candidatus Acetothermia bacterium]